MKIRNILLIVSISLLSSISCFADKIKIENPYENVEIQLSRFVGQKIYNAHRYDHNFIGNQELDSPVFLSKIQIRVVLNKGTKDEIKLDQKTFTYDHPDNEGQHYVEEFYIGKKRGKIAYSIKVNFTKLLTKLSYITEYTTTIRSVEIKVAYAELDDQEFSEL